MNNETILIVDDEPANLAVLNMTLKNDYKVRAANSGARALQVTETDPRPDLILLDIMMPEMDGMEVISRIKDYPELDSLPVIMQTAKDSKRQQKTARKTL